MQLELPFQKCRISSHKNIQILFSLKSENKMMEYEGIRIYIYINIYTNTHTESRVQHT